MKAIRHPKSEDREVFVMTGTSPVNSSQVDLGWSVVSEGINGHDNRVLVGQVAVGDSSLDNLTIQVVYRPMSYQGEDMEVWCNVVAHLQG